MAAAPEPSRGRREEKHTSTRDTLPSLMKTFLGPINTLCCQVRKTAKNKYKKRIDLLEEKVKSLQEEVLLLREKLHFHQRPEDDDKMETQEAKVTSDEQIKKKEEENTQKKQEEIRPPSSPFPQTPSELLDYEEEIEVWEMNKEEVARQKKTIKEAIMESPDHKKVKVKEGANRISPLKLPEPKKTSTDSEDEENETSLSPIRLHLEAHIANFAIKPNFQLTSNIITTGSPEPYSFSPSFSSGTSEKAGRRKKK